MRNDMKYSDAEWEKISRILERYYGEWTSPDYPEAVSSRIPNTALLGNGNIGISSDGSSTVKSYRISKGDFWEYKNSPMPVGILSISAADATGEASAEFNEKEEILTARIITKQTFDGVPLEITSWMSAVSDVFVTEIKSCANDRDADLRVTLEGYVNGNRPVTAEVRDDCIIVTRSTLGAEADDPKSHTPVYISKTAIASRIIGADAVLSAGDTSAELTLHLPAGKTVYVVSAICGGGRTYDKHGKLWEGRREPTDDAFELVNTISCEDDAQKLYRAHFDWWKNYWMQSYVSLDTSDDDLAVLQKYYYAAQYLLGIGIREGYTAAGLYGIWHTNDVPFWHSDFHLNYNFISTYYGLPTSNRTSMLLPAVDALMEYVPQGIKNAGAVDQLFAVYEPFARELIEKGQVDAEKGISDAILYPVAIGPYGMTLEYNSYHHETVNAPFSAYPMIEYYNFTQDDTFMKDTLYVYLKHVITFLEHWLVEEEGKYTLYAGYNEGSWAKNPALELAVYKMCLSYGIKISEKLGVDGDRRENWKKIYAGLAEQPVVENFGNTGKTVLSLAEKEWVDNEWLPMSTPVPGDGNCIPLESIIPGEVFGYYSTADELEVLGNTIDVFSERGAWTQVNNFPKLSPVAVNARYDCRKIVAGLSNAIRRQMKKNMMIEDTVHGIEKAGAVEAVNNMMLLSDKGVIRLFGNWIEDRDAEFCRLRASGAFLFSAAYSGAAREIEEGALMYSEAGGKAVVASLWKDGMTVLDENGAVVETVRGTAPNHPEEITYTFAAEAGKTYRFVKA